MQVWRCFYILSFEFDNYTIIIDTSPLPCIQSACILLCGNTCSLLLICVHPLIKLDVSEWQ